MAVPNAAKSGVAAADIALSDDEFAAIDREGKAQTVA